MITWTLRPWRSIGLAAAVVSLAACGQPAAMGDDEGVPTQAGEGGERADDVHDDSGGEAGESGESGEAGEGGTDGPG